MRNLVAYIKESQDYIVLDELSNPEIKRITKKLEAISKRTNNHVYDVDIQMGWKQLYGLNIVLSWNDITFVDIDNISYICINFSNGDFVRGEHYWDPTEDEWIPYQK